MVQEKEILFRETQRFRQPGLWLLMAAVGLNLVGFVVYAMVQQLVMEKPLGGRPIPEPLVIGLGLLLIIGVVGFLVVMGLARLVTEVRPQGISVNCFPFHRSPLTIVPENLKSIEPRAFRSVRELRQWKSNKLSRSDIFTVNGSQGVHLELTNGRCYFIGSENPVQLARALLYTIDPDNTKLQGCAGTRPGGYDH